MLPPFQVLLYRAAVYGLPFLWPCETIPDFHGLAGHSAEERERLVKWICPDPNQYSPMASIGYGTAEQVVTTLFSHKTPGLYPYSCLLAFVALYFSFACYTAGSSISSGCPSHAPPCTA